MDKSSDIEKIIGLVRSENGCSRSRMARKFGWVSTRITAAVDAAIEMGVVRVVIRKPGRQSIAIYEMNYED